jgi:choline dehydrogenase-like flavoprotein
MDHRVSMPGMILLSEPDVDLNFYRFNRMPSGQMVEGSLHLTEETVRAERMCGAQFSMEPYQGVRSQGDVSLTKLREGLSRFIDGGGWMPDFVSHLSNVVRDIDHVAGNIMRRVSGAREDLSVWLLKMEVEQTPNPDSRVTLIDETDSLGLRRVNLNWQTQEIEKHTVVRSLEILGEELGRLGIGRVKIDMADDPNVWSRFDTWGYHLAGTTRMSSSPKEGVVDGDCRVHGVGNLYIAGNSLFPTVGTCNPTFTITSLSVRLAHHLKGILA